METTYNYAGRTFNEIRRFGVLRLFRQNGGEHYELHKCKMRRHFPNSGKVGKYLGLSALGDWGSNAWTFLTAEGALEHFDALVKEKYPNATTTARINIDNVPIIDLKDMAQIVAKYKPEQS